MKKKQKLFLGFVVIIIATIITMVGCELPEGDTFPSEFIGTWKRPQGSSYSNTLTFTKNTIKASNLNYSFDLQSVSGDVYKVKSSESGSIYNLTIIIENNNLKITGDTYFYGQDNWNDTWRR